MGVAMSVTGVEWLAVGFFLVSLILFRHCEKPIKAESVEGYRRLTGVLTILSLTALSRLYQSIGVFQQVPFLSETVFFDLVYWVMVIAGGAMLVSGAAHWLPLARQNRQLSQVKIARLDLLRRIEQLIGVENRLDTILTHVLQYMREASNLGAGVVFKFSSHVQQLRIVSTTPDFEGDARELERGICSRIRARQAAGKTVDPVCFLADCLAQEQGRPAITIPIEVTGHAVGMFAFWSKDRAELEPDVHLILQLAAGVVARKVAIDTLSLRLRNREERAAWLETTRTSVEAASETRLRFVALSKAIAERLQVDTVTLSVVPQGSRMTRFTWSRGGRTLVEHLLPTVPVDRLTGPAYHSGQTVLYHNLSDDRQPGREEVLTMGSSRSLVAIPVKSEDVTIVLTLTSAQKNAFSNEIVAELRHLSPLITLVVLPELMQRARRIESRRMEKLAHMLSCFASEGNQQSVLIALAGLASEEYGADLLRVSQIDETGMFLESKVLVSAVSLQCSVPAHGRIILSLAPVHERALKIGMPIVVSQSGDDSVFSEIETAQTLANGIKHAAIIPVLRDGKSIGLMTLGAVDHELAGVRDIGDLAFAEALAAVASMVLISESPLSLSTSSDNERQTRLKKAALPVGIGSGIDSDSPRRVRLHADMFS
jgi:transcriptional regulator with GAF, ATPase, and Fis domain